MSKIVKPLTNMEVGQAKPKEKEYNLSDGKGLMIRIKPNGSKLWLFNYTHPISKKRKNISFGSYPEVSLSDARELRRSARIELSKKIDPKESRELKLQERKKQFENTFSAVAANWYEVKKTTVSSDYALDIWRSFELHLLPYIGDYPINTLTAIKTIETLKPIALKGNLETIRRLCQRINEVMTFAVNTGVIFSNPLTGINHAFQSPQRKSLPTITPSELPVLMSTLSTASLKIVTRMLIEWQLHTMVRPSEAAKAKWCEVNFSESLWIIPPERMKMNREHIVPLSNQAITLLEKIKPISSHLEFIFPSDRNPKTHVNVETANKALRRLGYSNKLVSHGLRSLASTVLNEQGFDGDIIETALAHVDKNDVRRAYNRAKYIERRRVLMAWWSDYIEGAAQGNVSIIGGYKALKIVNP